MNDLLTQSNIIKNKQKYVPKKGVYFLIFKNKIKRRNNKNGK
jgi:hypothetical protein